MTSKFFTRDNSFNPHNGPYAASISVFPHLTGK